MDDVRGSRFIVELPARLRAAIGVDELVDATAPVGPGASRVMTRDSIRAGAHLLASPVPSVEITLDPPIDAQWLIDAWSIDRPVAMSGDVHQSSWHIVTTTSEWTRVDGATQLDVDHPAAGRWQLKCRLTSRPAGPLPRAVAGASPAYDVRETGGLVRWITVSAQRQSVDVVSADHPHALELTSSMAERWPHARPGWRLAPDDQFVVALASGGRPIVGAALPAGHDEALTARCLSAAPDALDTHAGSFLLDTLEAIALDRGTNGLRLDGSVFFVSDAVPYARHGYRVMPPYDGDADTPVWVERTITRRTGP